MTKTHLRREDQAIAELTFRDLEIFLEFSNTEHLGETADALGHSVAVIQRSVRSLERRMGVRLIERHGRRLRLLHAGRVLAEQAAAILRTRMQVVEEVQLAASRKRRRLRIGHNFSFGLDVIPDLVRQVMIGEPELQILLKSGTTNDLIADVLSGALDAAMVSPFPVEADLEVLPMATELNVLIVAPTDPLASRQSVDLLELRDRSFVALSNEVGSRQTLLQACARAGFSPHIPIEVGDMLAIEGVVATGLAIAIVPARLAKRGSPRIVGLPLAPKLASDRNIGIVFLRKARDRPVLALLREAAARHSIGR